MNASTPTRVAGCILTVAGWWIVAGMGVRFRSGLWIGCEPRQNPKVVS